MNDEDFFTNFLGYAKEKVLDIFNQVSATIIFASFLFRTIDFILFLRRYLLAFAKKPLLLIECTDGAVGLIVPRKR